MRIYDCDERSGGFDLHIPTIDGTFFSRPYMEPIDPATSGAEKAKTISET